HITVAAALAWSAGQTLTLDAFDDIIIGEAITISAGGGLELLAGGISLDAPIAAPGGTLSVAADGTITTTSAGEVSVGTFILQSGDWTQLGDPLPAFEADDFRIEGGSFLRALGGSGASGTPFLLTDIYGLQGMDGFPSGSFALANDIDASGTSNWNFTPVDDIDPRFPGYFAGFDPLGG